MPRRYKPIKLLIRFYPGQDNELIRWLEQLDDQPYGTKTQAIKAALLRGIGGDSDQATEAPAALDLGEVRQVVEAAVTTALNRFEGQMGRAPIVLPGEEDETENLLDALESALVLREDGE
jgi:hypothetical protein